MITGCLEAVDWRRDRHEQLNSISQFRAHDLPILASCVGDGATLAGGIYVAVAAVTGAVRISLLLEVDAILLCVGSSELAIARQVALLTDNGRRLGVLVVVLAHCQGHECGHCELRPSRKRSRSES